MTTLSAAQIDEILQALDALCGDGNGRDRRQAKRNALSIPLELVLWDSHSGIGTSVTVMLRDFSAGGLGFVHALPMEPGSRLLVRLPMKGSRLGYIPCLVTSCTPKDDGSYRIGARFGDLLPEQDQPQTDPQHAALLRQALLG